MAIMQFENFDVLLGVIGGIILLAILRISLLRRNVEKSTTSLQKTFEKM